MTILSDVKALGQQIWLDNLSRSLVQSGELAEMLKQGVCGVTSNPAIFQKAFAGDTLYADEVAALKQQDLTPKQRYETMAVADVQAACDVCLAEHESTGGKTGFVSLEVSPELSKDAQGTVEEARRLPTQNTHQLLIDDLHDLLRGVQGLRHFRTKRTLLHMRNELTHHRNGDVRIQQRTPDLPHGRINISL